MYHNFFTRSSKTTMRYHLIPVIMGINKKSTNNKCWRGCRKKGTLFHCWWECKLIQPLWRTVWRFLLKLGRRLPYDPAIPLLGIYPEEARIEKDLPGSSVHAVFQARVLEWFAIFFSRGSSQARNQTQVSWVVSRCFIIWATRKIPWNTMNNPKLSSFKTFTVSWWHYLCPGSNNFSVWSRYDHE